MTLSMPKTRKLPAWLDRLIASKPKQMAQPRCECGRFCAKDHKPDITDKLVADMSKAGLYVPPHFAQRGQGRAA